MGVAGFGGTTAGRTSCGTFGSEDHVCDIMFLLGSLLLRSGGTASLMSSHINSTTFERQQDHDTRA